MNKPSRIISKVLAPALHLWLRSQIEQVEFLDIKISGGDHQILKGYIPSVFLSSSRAVYKGLHLGKVQLTGENIRINVGQVLKGKPLCLLEPLQVTGRIHLEEADLQTSLSSSLFSNALTDLLLLLLETQGLTTSDYILKESQVSWQEIRLNRDKFILNGTLVDGDGTINPLTIRAGLELVNTQTLRLHPVQIEAFSPLLNVALSELPIDLGSDVKLETLNLEPGQLSCWGCLIVRS
jgi:hypothetical protein